MLVSVLGACKKTKSGSISPKATSAKTTAKTTTKRSTGTTAKTDTGSDIDQGYVEPGEDEDEDGNIEEDTGNNGDEDEVIIDLGGREFKVFGWQDFTIPRLGVDPYMDEVYYKWKEAEVKYNFKLNYMAYPKYWDDFKNSFLAGIKFTDVLNIPSANVFPNWIIANMLSPIDDIMVDIDSNWNRKIHSAASWKDKLYGFNKTAPGGEIGYGVIYNKTLFEKEGFEDLYKIMMRGEWTWDVFLEFAKIATKDFNGDGIIDQWGVGAHNMQSFINTLRYSNGGRVLLYENGVYDTGILERNAITALQFATDLINYYKFSSISILNYDTFNKGLTPMMLAESWFAKNIYVGRTFSQMSNIGFVLPPKGPGVNDYQNFRDAANIFAFPSDNQDLKATVKIFYETYIQNLNNTADNFEILKHIEYFFPDPDFFEIFKRYATNVQYDLFSGITGLNALINTTMKDAASGNIAVGSILEANRPQIQQIINIAN
jgi:multiple sugar transport system substrate-binding protein